jgi:hypothetical protein
MGDDIAAKRGLSPGKNGFPLEGGNEIPEERFFTMGHTYKKSRSYRHWLGHHLAANENKNLHRKN